MSLKYIPRKFKVNSRYTSILYQVNQKNFNGILHPIALTSMEKDTRIILVFRSPKVKGHLGCVSLPRQRLTRYTCTGFLIRILNNFVTSLENRISVRIWYLKTPKIAIFFYCQINSFGTFCPRGFYVTYKPGKIFLK